MTNKYKVFILGLRAGVGTEGVERFLAESLGVADEAERKRLIFEAPSLLYEAATQEEADRIRDRLETVGARIEIKNPLPRPDPQDLIIALQSDLQHSSSRKTGQFIAIIAFILIVAVVVFFINKIADRTPTVKKRLSTVKSHNDRALQETEAPVVIEPSGKAPVLDPKDELDNELAGAYKEIEENNYPRAWKILTAYLEENTNHPKAINGLKYVAFQLARQAYKRGDVQGAIQYLDTALEFAPDAPELNEQIGALYYAIKDYDNARSYFDDALRAGSTNPNIHLSLARIYYYHDNDMLLAQEHLSSALELDPSRKDIEAFLNKIRSEESIEGDFQAAESEHFVVKYEGVEDSDAAYTVLYILDEAWSDVGYDLGDYPPDSVVVILYTKKQFKEVTRAPHWAGAIYDGRIRLPVAGLPDKKDDDLRRVLYHEYTHVVVHRITNGRCPVWLNEGLAQFMQVRSGASPDPWMRPSVLGSGRSIPSLRSLSAPFLNLGTRDALRAYVTSYFAVKFLVDEYGLTYASRLLEEVGKGVSVDMALREVIGIGITEFEQRFHQYLDDIGD